MEISYVAIAYGFFLKPVQFLVFICFCLFFAHTIFTLASLERGLTAQ